MGARARDVGTVRLGQGSRSVRTAHVSVLCLGGLEPVPGGGSTWDRTLPTTLACVDAMLRRFGAAPTYLLTDNERVVTSDRVAGLAVRHPVMVAAARHYGLVIETCVPYDPETKGGSESSVKIAKADLVPTEANLSRRLQQLRRPRERLRRLLRGGEWPTPFRDAPPT